MLYCLLPTHSLPSSQHPPFTILLAIMVLASFLLNPPEAQPHRVALHPTTTTRVRTCAVQPITLLVAVFASSGNGFSFLAASMSMRARSLGSLVALKRLCSWATPAGTALDEESDCSAAQRSAAQHGRRRGSVVVRRVVLVLVRTPAAAAQWSHLHEVANRPMRWPPDLPAAAVPRGILRATMRPLQTRACCKVPTSVLVQRETRRRPQGWLHPCGPASRCTQASCWIVRETVVASLRCPPEQQLQPGVGQQRTLATAAR